jgi:hypothetical protein
MFLYWKIDRRLREDRLLRRGAGSLDKASSEIIGAACQYGGDKNDKKCPLHA